MIGFLYKRFIDDPTNLDVTRCPSQSNNICNVDGVNLQLPGSQPIAFDDNPRVEFVQSGLKKTIPMYYQGCFGQIYNYVKLQVLPNVNNASLNFYFKIIDDRGEITYSPDRGALGTEELFWTAGTDSAKVVNMGDGQWELVLDNRDGQDLNVSIVASRSPIPTGCSITSTGTGLPFVGEQVLRIRALYQGLSRTYQVRIPIP